MSYNIEDESIPPFDLDEDSMEKESLVHDEAPEYDVALAEEASREYVGQWNRLVSTTNWEKGRLISRWRESMQISGVPIQLYTDEAWSRRIGNISSQHVGRLRRVYERFADVYQDYSGLYWSHFQAAIDWEDAEVWLEGAVQQHWSVANMRKQRWLAIGAPPDCKPSDEDVILSELDEDVTATLDSGKLSGLAGTASLPQTPNDGKVRADGIVGSTARDGSPLGNGTSKEHTPHEANPHEHDFDDEPERPVRDMDSIPPAMDAPVSAPFEPTDPADIEDQMRDSVSPSRLFENLPTLPDDLAEAFDLFKLAILNHKLARWGQVRKDDVLITLAMLRQLCED